MNSDIDRQRFAKKCWARRRAGLVLAGSWTVTMSASLKAAGAIWDAVRKEWLLPDLPTWQRFNAMRPGLEAADPEPDVRGVVAGWQQARFGCQREAWPSDLETAQRLIADFGALGAQEVAVELARVVSEAWPECQSLAAAWRAYGAVTYHMTQEKRDRAERERQKAADREAQRLQEEADKLRRQAADVRWHALPAEKRREIEDRVRRKTPWGSGVGAMFHHQCLVEAGCYSA